MNGLALFRLRMRRVMIRLELAWIDWRLRRADRWFERRAVERARSIWR